MTNYWIYVIQAGDGPVKIGIARSPVDRLVQHQTSNHETLRLIAAWPGNYREENNLHRQFQVYQIHSEWFEYSEEIQALVADMGLPKVIKCKPHADFA